MQKNVEVLKKLLKILIVLIYVFVVGLMIQKEKDINIEQNKFVMETSILAQSIV